LFVQGYVVSPEDIALGSMSATALYKVIKFSIDILVLLTTHRLCVVFSSYTAVRDLIAL
jgi:hypothetical protein